MSKEDKVFKEHPNLKRYFKTADGTPFYKKEHANAHARSLKNKKVEEVENSNPKKSVQPKETPSKNKATLDKLDDLNPMQKAKLRKNAIEKLATVSEVKEALNGETANSVIKAGEARIKALEAGEKAAKTTTEEEE